MSDYLRIITNAPIYVKIADDDMMAAEVYNSETIRLTFCGTWLNPAEWTETEREFVAAARREALAEMAE